MLAATALAFALALWPGPARAQEQPAIRWTHLIADKLLVINKLARWPAPIRTHNALDGIATIIDGDTIAIAGQRLRLYGIDAPETGQTCTRAGRPWRCGTEAGFALANLIGRHWIHCVTRVRDAARPVAAVCYLANHDVNAAMVRAGWALDDRRHPQDGYAAEEAAARQARRGLWSGGFMAPWEWRRRHGGRVSTR